MPTQPAPALAGLDLKLGLAVTKFSLSAITVIFRAIACALQAHERAAPCEAGRRVTTMVT